MPQADDAQAQTRDVFGPVYGAAYDALYAEKDYELECDFVEEIFRRFSAHDIEKVLDLGCGTGGHAVKLASRGYQVTGVDISEEMLARAEQKATAVERAPRFVRADIRSFSLADSFDAAIAMFAVMSYQTTDDELVAAIRAVRAHLADGGLFVFDVWFGPGVLTDPAHDRFRVVETETGRVIRLVHSELNLAAQVVDVQYHVVRIEDRVIVDETRESHRMRFLFPRELESLLQRGGLELVHLCPVAALDRSPALSDWNVCAIARRT